MTIRLAKKEDLPELQRLLSVTWHDTYDDIYGQETVEEITQEWHSLDALESAMVSPASLFLVSVQITIDGMAFCTIDGQTVRLHQLYVDPNAQNTGLGKRLHSTILEHFNTAEEISLEVEPQNYRAIQFYRKLGYFESGETQDCGQPNSGIKATVMTLPVK